MRGRFDPGELGRSGPLSVLFWADLGAGDFMVSEIGDRVSIWPVGMDHTGYGTEKRAGTVDTVFSDGTIIVTFPDGGRSLCRPNLYHVEKIDGPRLVPAAN